MDILAKEDFTEEKGFDLGNRFLLQKPKEDCPELVGILSSGSWQDEVGALDLAGVDSGIHTQDYFCVQSLETETYSLFCGSQTLFVVSSHHQLCPLHRLCSG